MQDEAADLSLWKIRKRIVDSLAINYPYTPVHFLQRHRMRTPVIYNSNDDRAFISPRDFDNFLKSQIFSEPEISVCNFKFVECVYHFFTRHTAAAYTSLVFKFFCKFVPKLEDIK